MKPAAFGSMFALAVFASMAGASDPVVLDLWPGKAPGETGKPVEEKSKVETWGRSVTNITKPTITVYRPAKEKDTGAALIIAPGGAFRFLAIEHEGNNVAQWCNTIGVTGIVLKYRVPRRPDNPQAALQDGQRAVSLVRSKAKEWGIDPDRIGMIGFSAGGGVTAHAMDKRLFCKLGSDGMTIDEEGNVYLTGQGVTVFDKTGKQIKHIPVPEPWTANVCFGGKDKQTLFITASKSLYSLNMRVRGVGSQ